jgi:hypothetical protein
MTETAASGRIEDGSIEIATLDVSLEPRHWLGGFNLHIDYTLRATDGNPSSVIFLDPENLRVKRVTCAQAATVTRERRRGIAVIEVIRREDTSFDGATVRVEAQWDRRTMRGMRGSPFCVIPSDLPLPPTRNGYVYPDEPFSDPERGTDALRIRLGNAIGSDMGTVRDSDGELLMAVLPMSSTFSEHVVYADDALVMGGAALSSLSMTYRAVIQDRLLEIHRFLGEELGRGDRVRAAVVCDTGAFTYGRGVGQFAALEERMMIQIESGRLLAERLVAREFAAMWWSYGARPAGKHGPTLVMALSLYCTMRWFEVSGRQEGLDNEIAYLEKFTQTVHERETQANPSARQAASTALALYAASKNGPELGNELRRWCAAEWGRTMPMAKLAARLGELGVVLPS